MVHAVYYLQQSGSLGESQEITAIAKSMILDLVFRASAIFFV